MTVGCWRKREERYNGIGVVIAHHVISNAVTCCTAGQKIDFKAVACSAKLKTRISWHKKIGKTSSSHKTLQLDKMSPLSQCGKKWACRQYIRSINACKIYKLTSQRWSCGTLSSHRALWSGGILSQISIIAAYFWTQKHNTRKPIDNSFIFLIEYLCNKTYVIKCFKLLEMISNAEIFHFSETPSPPPLGGDMWGKSALFRGGSSSSLFQAWPAPSPPPTLRDFMKKNRLWLSLN